MDINQIEGLSAAEAAARQRQYGYNELPDKNKKNILKIIYGLATEPMIFLLLATVSIYFILGDKNEAFLLLLSFFGIIAIELYQETKTEKSLEALRNLSSPICDVIRGGKKLTIPGRELVVGDIIILSEGSRVPADAKLISAENLNIDESLLTGESVAVNKHIRNIKDFRTNSVFSGTLVVKGHGIAEVTSIGQSTEIGKIGVSLKGIETEKTLLQKEVNKVIKFIASLAITASLLLVLIFWIGRGDFLQGMLAGLTLAIAILPEEFPIVLTIFLTLGAWRLAKNNILTRRAHTIETLGSATVLCVDKTGTLTENKMEVISVIDSSGVEYGSDYEKAAELIKYGVLASQKNPFDPMEEAFIAAGAKVYGSLEKIYEHQKIIKEYPLEDGSLSVVNVWGNGDKLCRVAMKGAPEAVFELCGLDGPALVKAEENVIKLASSGLRVIAVASGKPQETIPDERKNHDFTFLGLVGLADPIRKEAPRAIEICKQAGIRVVMITGDYPETAKSIADKIGLDSSGVMTGEEFESLSEAKKRQVINQITVFSRVTPANKLTIVKTLKKMGEVVAMTGDGVNDAPALKAAHVGIAMGKRGTDVAREAASIVLLDDNFASIVKGVRLGRRIYDNLRKAMSYIISIHIPIAALSLIPALFKWPIMLIPAHIVFLEFIIDPSCTIIFENEKESADIMKRKPRKLTDPIFSRNMVSGSVIKGLFVAIVVLISYKIFLDSGFPEGKARGITFIILIVANILLILGISGSQAKADILHRENIAMLTILLATSLSLIAVFNIPFLRELFLFSPLSLPEASIGVSIGIFSILGIIPLRALAEKLK